MRALPLRRGLVCAGGGVTGAIYEIGVLAALEERLDGFSLTECDVFVGVSAGSYVGTLVASGVSPFVLFRNVTHPRTTDIDQLALFGLNIGEIALAAHGSGHPRTPPGISTRTGARRRSRTSSLIRRSPAVGVFHNQGLEAWPPDG